MDMHCRKGVFDGAQEVTVEKAIEVARQAALDAHFGGAAIPRLLSAANDLFERKRVSVGGLRTTAKSAEAATHKTDVGEIDVAVDDVSDRFAHGLPTQMVRDDHEGLQIRTPRDC